MCSHAAKLSSFPNRSLWRFHFTQMVLPYWVGFGLMPSCHPMHPKVLAWELLGNINWFHGYVMLVFEFFEFFFPLKGSKWKGFSEINNKKGWKRQSFIATFPSAREASWKRGCLSCRLRVKSKRTKWWLFLLNALKLPLPATHKLPFVCLCARLPIYLWFVLQKRTLVKRSLLNFSLISDTDLSSSDRYGFNTVNY